MEPDLALPLLGGLTPQQFMRRHWQKKPLLVRQALPGVAAPVSRTALFELAAGDAAESRLVQRRGDGWSLRHGPLPRQGRWRLFPEHRHPRVPAAPPPQARGCRAP